MRIDRPSGFTLIELAVVLAVVALLLGSLLVPLSTQVERRQIAETRETLDDIRQALFGYALSRSPPALPCPDTDSDPDGVGNLDGTGECAGGEGVLPWVTLGIGRQDAWGNHFRYRVDKAFSGTDGIPDPANTISGILVYNLAGDPLAGVQPSDRPIAVVFSCGANGMPDAENDMDGTPNTDALCSNPPPGGIIDKEYTQDNRVENGFDDILIWISKNVLLNRLVTAGKWP